MTKPEHAPQWLKMLMQINKDGPMADTVYVLYRLLCDSRQNHIKRSEYMYEYSRPEHMYEYSPRRRPHWFSNYLMWHTSWETQIEHELETMRILARRAEEDVP
jgi:hypothetical protein